MQEPLACVPPTPSPGHTYLFYSRSMNNYTKPIILLSLLIAAFGSGCASYKGGAVQIRDAAQFANAQKVGGVEIGAEAIVTEAKSKEIFYVNLGEQGYFPVEVAVFNQTNARILIERDRVDLVSNSGATTRPVTVTAMIDEFEKNKMAYALLGFGIFSYMSAEDANKKMAADWSAKEFTRETIVAPSRRSTGFIYFKLPKGEKPTGMELVVPAENLETKTTESLRLRL